jgi:hypothetical protein
LYKKLNIREKELQELREQRSSMEVQINEIKSAIDLLYESRGEYLPKSQFVEVLNKRVAPKFDEIENSLESMRDDALINKREMNKAYRQYLSLRKSLLVPTKNIRKKSKKK